MDYMAAVQAVEEVSVVLEVLGLPTPGSRLLPQNKGPKVGWQAGATEPLRCCAVLYCTALLQCVAEWCRRAVVVLCGAFYGDVLPSYLETLQTTRRRASTACWSRNLATV